MSSPPPPPPPDVAPPQVDDSPLEQFLERAAPILAVERGINARSRVRLLAVAQDVGLPDDEFEQAVRLLQRAPAKTESPDDKITEPFRRYLNAKIEQSTVKTFTPALESRVVQVAVEKFELDEAQARAAIAQVTAECGVKRFSQADCEAYVANLVAERLGDAEWLDDESVNRLRTAGAQWGLEIAEIDALIVAKAAANRESRGTTDSTTRLVLTIAVVAGVGVFLVLAVLVLWGSFSQNDGAAENGESGAEGETLPGERATPARPQKWWNVDLSLAQSKARALLPEYGKVYELLCSEDAAERGKGYEQLIGLVQGDADQAELRDVLREVAAGCYCLDPEDAAAEQLREALLAAASPDPRKLPPGPEAYEVAIWSVETALEAVYHRPANEGRTDAMAAALGKSLGLAFELEKPRPTVERRCLAALATALYRQLAAGAPDSPRLARRLHDRLAGWAQEYLDLAEFERLDVNVLAAVLAASESAWREYEPLLAANVGSKDPLVVLKMLELYERAQDRELQEFLAELLLLRVRARPKSSAPADVAAAVREALGVVTPVAPATAHDRWQTLRGLAAEGLARRPPLVTETAKMLEDSLHLAHLGTLGCALAQQEPGFALFDQLVKDGPPSLTPKKKEGEEEPEEDAPRSEGPPPPTASQQRDLARFLDGLARYKDLTPLQRLTYLRGLGTLVERFAEIEPEQGLVVARFLLAEKMEDEQRRVNDSVATLCRWKSVRMALADLLLDAESNVKISLPLAARLFSNALSTEVNLGSADWPERVREQLLRSVLADLAAVSRAAPADGARGIDRAPTLMLDLYLTRARLLGLGPAQYRNAATPAAALELLANHLAAQLGGGAGRPADTELLTRLPHEMNVVEYLGSNDIRRTVLAQRIWLRLLSISLARKRPEQAAAAARLVDELTARDQRSTHVLLQLRDGEATTLQLWLLHAPKE